MIVSMSGTTLYINGNYKHIDILDLDYYILNALYSKATNVCIRNVYTDVVINTSKYIKPHINIKFKKCIVGEYNTSIIRRLDIIDSKIKIVNAYRIDTLNLSYSNVHKIHSIILSNVKIFSCNIGIISSFISNTIDTTIKKSSIGALYGVKHKGVAGSNVICYSGKLFSIERGKEVDIDYSTDTPTILYKDIPSDLYDNLIMLLPYSI